MTRGSGEGGKTCLKDTLILLVCSDRENEALHMIVLLRLRVRPLGALLSPSDQLLSMYETGLHSLNDLASRCRITWPQAMDQSGSLEPMYHAQEVNGGLRGGVDRPIKQLMITDRHMQTRSVQGHCTVS